MFCIRVLITGLQCFRVVYNCGAAVVSHFWFTWNWLNRFRFTCSASLNDSLLHQNATFAQEIDRLHKIVLICCHVFGRCIRWKPWKHLHLLRFRSILPINPFIGRERSCCFCRSWRVHPIATEMEGTGRELPHLRSRWKIVALVRESVVRVDVTWPEAPKREVRGRVANVTNLCGQQTSYLWKGTVIPPTERKSWKESRIYPKSMVCKRVVSCPPTPCFPGRPLERFVRPLTTGWRSYRTPQKLTDVVWTVRWNQGQSRHDPDPYNRLFLF